MINPGINMNMNNIGQLICNITNQTNNLNINQIGNNSQPKIFMEKNNLSTGLSTNESNESFDSNQNKINNIKEDRCKK